MFKEELDTFIVEICKQAQKDLINYYGISQEHELCIDLKFLRNTKSILEDDSFSTQALRKAAKDLPVDQRFLFINVILYAKISIKSCKCFESLLLDSVEKEHRRSLGIQPKGSIH